MGAQLEREVSRHIGAMPFLWIAVASEPDRTSDRSYIERNAIALLSCINGGPDLPNAGWLGRQSDRAPIRESGLWNINHVNDQYDPGFLQVLAALVPQTPVPRPH